MLCKDVSDILEGSTLSDADRLALCRNMVLYVLSLGFGKVAGNRNKRRDAVVREVACKDPDCLKRADKWMQKASFARYYLSYLRRGVINYLLTGDLEESIASFRSEGADILLAYDVLDASGLVEQARTLAHAHGKPSSVMMSDTDVENVMDELTWDIRQSKMKIRFLMSAGVLEDSFVDTELKMWAYRTLYKREGVTDMVYLVNYLRTAVSNAAQNLRIAYMADKRYTGLIKVSDDEDNQRAEYQSIVQAISPAIEATASVDCDFEPTFLDKTIEHSHMDDTSKSVVRRFFAIVSGERDAGFDSWLESVGAEYPEDLDDLRNLAMQYLGMNSVDLDDEGGMSIMSELKATVKRSFGYDFNRRSSEGRPKKTHAQVVVMLSRMKADPFTKECVFAKELHIFSQGFLAYMAENGYDEVGVGALCDDDLNGWVDSYRESRIEEMTDNSEQV